MSVPTMFEWRAHVPADWDARCKELTARLSQGELVSESEEIELRRLASCALGPSEQLKLERLVKRFLLRAPQSKTLRPFRIGLVGARTLSYLAPALAAAGPARGLLIQAAEAPYDHVASLAYGASNPFAGQSIDAVVVLLDASSFGRSEALLDPHAEAQSLDGARELLHALSEAVRTKCGCPLILATIPEVTPAVGSAELATVGGASRLLRLINGLIVEGGAAREWVLWDLASLAAQVGHSQWFDPVRYHQAKVPFAIELSPLVADHLCALIAAMCGKSGRALVLDLDNTLWGGVVADDGVTGLRLGQNSAEGEAYLAFQRFILAVRDRGVVIAVCSKNTDAIAREPFRSHPEMILREEHIAVFQANWLDKATNIRAVADTLNLGLESLVFVDDNPAERARVRQELPLVQVPEVGDDVALFPIRLARSGTLEHLVLNREDMARADAYGAEAKRAAIRSRVGNYDEYLASLQMRMEIQPFDEVGRARIAQLINKSNQFNLTTRRYNEEDLRRMSSDQGVLCWQVRLNDTFGAHGMIAVVIVRKDALTWRIDSWLQSCRVLERGVEETLMNELVGAARQAGVHRMTGEYLPTARNGLVADFYPRLGFSLVKEEPDGRKAYECDIAGDLPRKSFIDVRLLNDSVTA